MKKLLLSLQLISIAIIANAYDFMVDGLCYNINSDGNSVSLTYKSTNWPAYSNLNGDLIIPDNVFYGGKTYIVTSIDESAFFSCSGLTEVTIPNSVTSIGSNAFYGCNGLTSITVPNSLTSIGGKVFYECTGLTSVTWNAKICNDCNYYNLPFENLTNIQSFSFGNEVEKIPAYLCLGLTGLTTVTIPNSVTSIGNSAFQNCSGLTSIEIPNSVTSIGNFAFYGCSNLKIAIIGENVTSIGTEAFRNCSFLENIVAMRERPIIINNNVFEGVPKASCDLHVREGSKIRYENQDVWKDFLIILEDAEDYADVSGGGSGSGIYGDVNGDGVVTAADVTAVYDILLGNE